MRCTTFATVVCVLCGFAASLLADPRSMPVPPKGAQYTIFCARIEGDAHVERSNRLKNDLIQKSGLRDWYVLHDDRQSLLYHGYYRTFNDTADRREMERAQSDLKRVKAMSVDGYRMFPSALFVDLDAPDPVAPPEWNLLNARGSWSLQIAAYKDSPLRKEAAVEAVREARKQGIEAYFYHGDTVSSVCLGAWPEEAVSVREAGMENANSTDPFLVTPAGLPDEVVRDVRDVKVLREEVQILDPTLLATMRQYPHHAVNGEQIGRMVNGKQVFDPSLLIKIPERPQGSDGLAGAGIEPNNGPGAGPGSDSRSSSPAPRPAPPPPGRGKLKSVDG